MNKNHGYGWILFIIGSFVAWQFQKFGCINKDINIPFYGTQNEKKVRDHVKNGDSTRMTLVQLKNECQNKISAENYFKEKIIEISGIAKNVEKGGYLNRPFVIIMDGTLELRCEFKNENGLEKVKIGKMITIRGECDGNFALKYCYFYQ